jgi:hypothetical protein
MHWVSKILAVAFATLAAGPSSYAAAGTPSSASEGIEFFEKSVRPLLSERCYECHSAQSRKTKGGLLLDTRDGVLKGGDSGPAVVLGAPEKSTLIRAVKYGDKDLQMPPKHRLDPEQVADLEKWVRMGAPDPRTNAIAAAVAGSGHWAFQPVKRPATQTVRNSRWVGNDIDNFILARLESNGLAPNPAAEKRALLCRATFDLIGLPPKPEEVEAFLTDRSPRAFENVVDRLLASPRYGERWGRYWLDLARYADTAGESADFPIPQAYKYRNYVIDAFNRDKPYDQFIREQIAGDLLPSASEVEKREHIVATGFVAMARRFGVDPENSQHLTIEDALDTMGKTMLGLSLSCARCHDHKYDPIPTQDYYALYGIFQSTRFPYPGSETTKHQRDFVPLIPAAEVMAITSEYSSRLLEAETELNALEAEEKQQEEAEEKGFAQPGTDKALPKRDLARLIGQAKRKRNRVRESPPRIESAYALGEGKPGNARIQKRGEPANLGEEVPRHFLSVLGGQSLPAAEKGSGRVELADWLSNAGNPLTARVMVNRIWQHHFGKGLVQTPSDFGARARPCTHPELLDFLAETFVRSGWSVKALHKLIMLSQTYQQASADNALGLRLDPNNDLLWKFNRQRLDAEAVRDSLLALSGDLDLSVGGAHPFPAESKWDFTQHSAFTAAYPTRQRSVYLMQQRIRKDPFFAVFDGTDQNASTAERSLSTTPLQALFFMNDSFAHAEAAQFGWRLVEDWPKGPKRIDALYRLTYGRPPRREEIRELENYLASFLRQTAGMKITVEKREDMAWASVARAVFGSNEFMFVE